MESSSQSRAGDIVGHIFVILVTIANLVLITRFHEYIAWYTIEPGGGITRLPLLTDAYFVWLPIPVAASFLAIAVYVILIFYDRFWFHASAHVVLSVFGVVIVLSLISIYPFDFSVIPDATAASVVPMLVTGFFTFMAFFYGITALVLSARLIGRYILNRG